MNNFLTSLFIFTPLWTPHLTPSTTTTTNRPRYSPSLTNISHSSQGRCPSPSVALAAPVESWQGGGRTSRGGGRGEGGKTL